MAFWYHFRSDSVKEMYTTRDELEYMVNSLEKKEETLAKVESGSIPDPPVVSQTPIDSKEPEVVTVQVGNCYSAIDPYKLRFLG